MTNMLPTYIFAHIPQKIYTQKTELIKKTLEITKTLPFSQHGNYYQAKWAVYPSCTRNPYVGTVLMLQGTQALNHSLQCGKHMQVKPLVSALTSPMLESCASSYEER